MKAKKYIRNSRRPSAPGEILPPELGPHLFALIKRNLLARHKRTQARPDQL